ncbi:MAG: glucose/sorbosone family PQQ-dependent dehydrogenase [Devosia sp.]
MNRFAAFVLFSLLATAAVLAQDGPDSVVKGSVPFAMRVLTTGLENPWELTWGPDDMLWVTERTAGRITRVDPADGSKTALITLEEVFAPGGQDGLLGLALDPGLLQGTGNDYVYAAYTYRDSARGPEPDVADPASPYRFLYTKIVRLSYDSQSARLNDPVELIAGLPASNDHNSGRLKLGPDGALYYTIGDGGKNQLGNWCIPIQAQRLPTQAELAAHDFVAYQGKSLRLNRDGSVPDDNPLLAGVRSHVFTYGHRNMQGIDFAPDGTLYASEQGPKTDDEVNILVPGGNYGWPHIAGFRDDKAYQYARWKDATTPCAQLKFSDIVIDPSVPVENETAWSAPFEAPLATLFTVPSDYNFSDPACNGIDFICWPTVAASSIAAYMPASGGIPGWDNSLLVTTLKRGSIYRLPLAADGHSLSGPIERYFQTEDRFRDTAFSPDMRTIYVATDSGGLAESLSGGTTTTMQHPGSILVFSYDSAATAAAEPAQASPVTGAPTGIIPAGAIPVSFTAEQASRGKMGYGAHCIACHGQNLIDVAHAPPLAGPYFARNWTGKTLAALYRKTHDTMPPSRPASLPEDQYLDILAYILQVNGLPAGDLALTRNAGQMDAVITPKSGGQP